MSVAAPHIDMVKLGFGTAYVTNTLKEKLEIYRSFDVPVYFGGTLFEAFLIRNQFEDYITVCKEYGISYMEVSDGSITIPHTEKCGYIEKLTKHGLVLSEVGSKDAAHIIPAFVYALAGYSFSLFSGKYWPAIRKRWYGSRAAWASLIIILAFWLGRNLWHI